jgi:site-specific recombinase XerD
MRAKATPTDGAMALTFNNVQLSKPSAGVNSSAIRASQSTELVPATTVSEYVAAATAHNTRRAYRSDLDHFLAWGGSIPSSPEQIAAYLAGHAGTHKAATLKRRVVAIGLAHTAQGLENPCAAELVRVTLRGIWRTHGMAQAQVTPAVREDILAMVRGLTGLKGSRDRALLLLGFAGAFRKSELVGLNVTDLEFVDRGLIVHLRRSKTDQEGVGRKVGIPHARGKVCAVQAVKEWLAASGITEGPLFRPITRHGHVGQARLSGHAVAEVVKTCAAAAGLDATNYSGHSLRAGLITSAAMLGVSIWKIKAQSGHHTDAMVGRYVRDADLFTDNAAGAIL